MPEFLIELVVRGIDVTDDQILQSIADTDVLTLDPISDTDVVVSAVVVAVDAVAAALLFRESLCGRVPDLEVLRTYRDLVGVTDIARRIGFTREAVRHWSSAKRGPGGFPSPGGHAASAGIWEWAAVNEWLSEHLNLGDGLVRPSVGEAGQIDSVLETLARSASSASRAGWQEGAVALANEAQEWLTAMPVADDGEVGTSHLGLAA